MDEKEAFVGICDIRIDSLKALSIHNLAKSYGALIALFATAIAIAPHYITSFGVDLPFFVVFSLIVLTFFYCFIYAALELHRFSVQIRAWYAVKEGVLLMKDE